MRAAANHAQSGLIALLLAVELTTLLSRHCLESFYVGRGKVVNSKEELGERPE